MENDEQPSIGFLNFRGEILVDVADLASFLVWIIQNDALSTEEEEILKDVGDAIVTFALAAGPHLEDVTSGVGTPEEWDDWLSDLSLENPPEEMERRFNAPWN